MKTPIIIIRHGKLDLPYTSQAEMPFSVLAALGRGDMDPAPDKAFASEKLYAYIGLGGPFNDIEHIFASPSQRCTGTATLFADLLAEAGARRPAIAVNEDIREIYFDLERICPPEFAHGFDIKDINDRVLRAMAEGACETAEAAYVRIDRFFTHMALPSSTSAALVITHGFLLRVMELYMQTRGARPKKITFEMLKTTHDDIYLRGFMIKEPGTITYL